MRFTVRRMMVAVAVVGVGQALTIWTQRRAVAFRHRATLHSIESYFPDEPTDPIPDRRTIYNRAMAQKYDTTARYPWLPVWPDPPEPK